ncbi:MAG: DUF6531 domain-containing protein [Bdellovibrionales bacterium]|nr:DUF6531 domain-containing protein [Bdellovibrionales bacterium]
MKTVIGASVIFLFTFQVFALVDTKNANYTKTFIDISLPGAGLPLMIERTYNSRSLFRGMFGYGWCSNLETRLEVMPDNTLMVVECGGGAEISYISKGVTGSRSILIGKIMAEVKKKKGLSKKYIKQVERDVKKSSLLQSELIRAFGLKGKAKSGQTYQALGRQNDRIQFTGNKYIRTLPTGQMQIFDKTGLLIKEQDKSGNWISLQRKKGTLVKVMDNKGRSLSFKRKGEVLTVIGPNKMTVQYVIKEDNLIKVTNSKGEKYHHFYDNYHNLTKTRYPDNTYEALTYNTDRDWVLSFKDRRGCKENYKYVTNKRNRNHYWTDVRKKCGKRVTNISRYEFWNKPKKDGSKYLYRAKQKVNGRVTDITYDMRTGSPLSVTRNRITTRYAYYENGFLKSRAQPGRTVLFSNYNNKCRKPKQVVVQYMQGRKVNRQVKTQISYGPKKCHLAMAKQDSTGRWVVVKRDHRGRIAEMRDQSKKRIIVAYNEKYSKPRKITRPGVGSIQVFYDQNGQVDTGRTQADPTVAAQVASVFNGFLEIISPVATDIII